MKKISREIKIGFVAIITIAILIWGWNFLKGINIFKTTDSYYAVYNDVHGLIKSGVVVLNGYKVGNVGAIQFNKDDVDRIVVRDRPRGKDKAAAQYRAFDTEFQSCFRDQGNKDCARGRAGFP